MIIQCDNCATKFRLDDSRITSNGVKVRCTKCQNVFIVMPPPPVEEVQVEEIFGISPGATPAPTGAGVFNPTLEETLRGNVERSKGAPSHKPKEDTKNLSFDFDANKQEDEGADFQFDSEPSEKEDGPSFEPEKKGFTFQPAADNKDGDPSKLSFNNIDFSFGQDPSREEEKTQENDADEWHISGSAPEVDTESGDSGTRDDDDKAEGPDIDFSFDDIRDDKAEITVSEWGAGEKEEEPEEEEPLIKISAAPPVSDKVIPFSAGYGKDGRTATPKPSLENIEEDDFSDILSKRLAKEDIGPFAAGAEEEDEGMEEETASRRPANLGLILAALIIVLGGGAVYFTGVIDMLAHKLMPPAESQIKTIEIETINGFSVDNSNFGKLFVIQARIKNITDEPQAIKAVTGIIYDEDGETIASQSVSPGRIVSMDDIRNLPKEELLKPFTDPSGGLIPPKGTVPVMVLFTEIPQGLAEYGLDIVR